VTDIEIAAVDRLHCTIAPHDWAFERERGAEIDAFWEARRSVNPALYDGQTLLAHRVERVEGPDETSLRVEFFATRFSCYLAWREFGFPDPGVFNCFSMPALRSADGAFLLAEMSTRHSSPGAIYFPAGSPDLTDVRGEIVDLEGNLIRELAEETGIEVAETRLAPEWRIVFAGPRVACMRIVDSPLPAAEILRRVRGHIAAEAEPELADVRMAFRRADLAEPAVLEFIRRFLEPLLPE
jgi:8-oxo-dGTP pyrophosphatase MutT (NUDIX family)